LGCGVINIGDTVELADAVDHKDDGTMHSGDFLRVKHIIQDTETGETRVKGHRMRRAKYLTPLIECKSAAHDIIAPLNVLSEIQ
jgi:DNA (cytosine-5)-methyltransferase 1